MVASSQGGMNIHIHTHTHTHTYLPTYIHTQLNSPTLLQGPVMVGSSQGGMNIEDVAAEHPDAIVRMPIDIVDGLDTDTALKMADKMEFSRNLQPQAAEQMVRLYNLFVAKDASMIEINPMAEDATGTIYCMDAKFNFDDNAEYRQKDVFAMRDWSQEDSREMEAANFNLNYIHLDSDIGCI
ncbi:PREDICTED: succinyl-CoA ligase [ADP-forming] subunit beta, mitochondrial-like, partial [Priapulus caudatus]|uniref:Succinyl-CoA ligase [ADP-forming] subunit beta, mitochondrial-like n=1 Tax=Priapulus caudatus TaxID=37621 RepID=A0ABM1F6K2_PRICU